MNIYTPTGWHVDGVKRGTWWTSDRFLPVFLSPCLRTQAETGQVSQLNAELSHAGMRYKDGELSREQYDCLRQTGMCRINDHATLNSIKEVKT